MQSNDQKDKIHIYLKKIDTLLILLFQPGLTVTGIK